MTYPIPRELLDDRLAWVGTSGYGKTYNASAGIEHVLARKHRVVISDPLDVWWGLRLASDGKTPSPYDVVIFGGKHADLPVTRHAGAIIGETVATMRESCIVSLGTLGSARERRLFMLDFLEALYHHTNPDKVEPYHVVFDEADLWAPQKPIEDEHKRLGARMEEIVRRGRVRGFIPWLITQRPAVLSKDVLSQADGLVSFKLTSSQDRKALGAWVQGQADLDDWKKMHAELATLERGTGVVWIPGAGILKTAAFPPKATYDSSKTPKRGERREKRELQPLDVDALKGRLSTVDAEAKANDPKALKAEIARLEAELKKKASAPAPLWNEEDITIAEESGRVRGYTEGATAMFDRMWVGIATFREGVNSLMEALARERMLTNMPKLTKPAKIIPQNITAPRSASVRSTGIPTASSQVNHVPIDGLSRSQQNILDALAWLGSIGIYIADRTRTALLAGVSHKSSGFEKNISVLKGMDLITYPSAGSLQLTAAGKSAARSPAAPPTTADLHNTIRSKVNAPQWNILAALIAAYPESLSREDLAKGADVSPLSSGFEKNVSTMRSFGFIDYPSTGRVAASETLFI